MKFNIASIILTSSFVNDHHAVNAFSPIKHFQPKSSFTKLHTTSSNQEPNVTPPSNDNYNNNNENSSSNANKEVLKDELRQKSTFVDPTTISNVSNEEELKNELRQKSTFVDPADELAYGGGSAAPPSESSESSESPESPEVSEVSEVSATTNDSTVQGMMSTTSTLLETTTQANDSIGSSSPSIITSESTTKQLDTTESKSESESVVEEEEEVVVVATEESNKEEEETSEEEEKEEKEEEVNMEEKTEIESSSSEVDVDEDEDEKTTTASNNETTIEEEITALVDEVNKLTNDVSEQIKEEKSKLNASSMVEEKDEDDDKEEDVKEDIVTTETVKAEKVVEVEEEEEEEEKVKEETTMEEPITTAASKEVEEESPKEETKLEEEKVPAEPVKITSITTERLEKILKPRPYPLFLAEKAALITSDILKGKTRYKDESPYEKYRQRVYGVKKEKIVILGTGWGSAAFLKDIDTNMYDVTVISPRNYFLFTPMLAGASVGTVDYRSITESVREINRRVKYLEGTAMEIDPVSKNIVCESVVCEGNSCAIEDFDVTYDKLIITVGAQTNTYGIPGVREYCCFLKQVEDAKRVRTAIVNCFERANLPNLNEEQKKAVLTFAVIGAGPTGVEFASELRDFIEQDGPKYYPDLLKYVRIKVIEASPTVLAPFDKGLQEEAIKQLTRVVESSDPRTSELLPDKFKLTELLLNSGVSEVKEDKILLNDDTEIPYGLAVWAAGNGPLPITLQVIDSLGKEGSQGEAQSIARGRLAVDAWLRVLDGDGSIFSFGDCSCITTGQLPATAQVASQQGEYLARLLSLGCDMYPGVDTENNSMIPPLYDSTREKELAEKISSFAINENDIAAPFQFLNLGILAYTGGGSALAQLQLTPAEQARVKGRGKIGFSLWRSVYLSKQVSWRNRCLVSLDWVKTQIFGRDITTFD